MYVNENHNEVVRYNLQVVTIKETGTGLVED